MSGRSPTQLPQPVIQRGVRGIEVDAVWVDEAVNVSPEMHKAVQQQYQNGLMRRHLDRFKMANFSSIPPLFEPEPRIKPVQIACRYCGAEPGDQCTRWRRTKRGKVRQKRDSYHPDRRHDAKLANTALDALKPREDMVTFRRPKPR